MTAPTPTIVVQLAVKERETVSETLTEFLSPLPVVVIGVVEIPDQTSSKQARDQFEDEARQTLETVETLFSDAGADVETRLSFTHDARRTVEQVATDIERVAVLFPAPMTAAERVLVAVRGGINVPNIAATVLALLEETDATATIYHAAREGADTTSAEQALTAVVSSLETSGIDRERIATKIERTDKPLEALVAAANEHDLLVVGEDEPKLTDRLFGDTSERIVERTAIPVVVVRRPPIEA